MKRGAKRASLQITDADSILTPQALYKWAKENLKEANVFFVSKNEHNAVKNTLSDRYSKAKAVPLTQNVIVFVPYQAKSNFLLKNFLMQKRISCFQKINK